jgi:hypothetical protein
MSSEKRIEFIPHLTDGTRTNYWGVFWQVLTTLVRNKEDVLTALLKSQINQRSFQQYEYNGLVHYTVNPTRALRLN